jgi:hypothetical protein
MELDRWLASVRKRLPRGLGRLVPRRSFLSCEEFCGHVELRQHTEELVARDGIGGGEFDFDWSDKQTTPDQLRIEQVLGTLKYLGARVLHVGVGSSGFARRWHDKVGEIVGITIASAEWRRAEELGLPNHRCHVINKYQRDLTNVPGGFDFIIDNNPSYAACCKFHFFTMWCSYRLLLKPGGTVMSDIEGMRWVVPGSDLRWSLDDRDLDWIAERFGFTVRTAGEGSSVRLLTA